MIRSVTMLRGLFVAAVLLSGVGHAVAATVDAIAVDDDRGTKGGDAGYGVGEGDSDGEAKHEALKQCKEAGNDDCKIAVTYDTCGAYASSRKYSGTGTGETEAAAKQRALESCGRDSCKIVTSDCVGK
jgi:hypothetical protein